MKVDAHIIIDTREQNPFTFENLPSKRGTLETGDCSVAGLTSLISVEHKSLYDLVQCVGRSRRRFERELRRLRGFRFRCVIVEADLNTIEAGGWRPKVTPAAVLGSISAWMAQYRIPFVFAGSHMSAGRFCERYLYQAARVVSGDYAAAQGLLDVVEGKS